MYKPKKPVRQNQLISPWGVGSMINFPGDESFMVAGLDAWEKEYQKADEISDFTIHESRLQQRLGVSGFRIPPDFRDKSFDSRVLNSGLFVPAVRFPRWHYCYYCGSMEKLSIYEDVPVRCKGYTYEKGFSCSDKPEKRRPFLIPVRFVAICDAGHITDFPFMEWVHTGGEIIESCRLRYEVRNLSSPLAAILISCTCGKKRTMAGSFNKDILHSVGYSCPGERPWLGEVVTENNTKPCSKEELHVVQRGGSNVYFPDIKSSIYVPDSSDSTKKTGFDAVIDKYWYKIGNPIDGNKPDRNRIEAFANANGFGPMVESLYEAVEKRLKSSFATPGELSEEEFRKSEYLMFSGYEGEQTKDYFAEKQDTGKYGAPVKDSIDAITLIHKLRETRALSGFTRWLPEDGKSLEERKAMLKSENSKIDWLPGIIVRGEGVFIGFDNDSLKKWEKRQSVQDRANLLIENYNHMRDSFGQPSRELNARFILLHTVAHLLINQFGLSCGYGSSSLRERIYCGMTDKSNMNGILIYTASGDSEGSMGGLVSQARQGHLEDLMSKSLAGAKWCSSDPVCISSRGQGPGSSNLAACHNCTLLPETSCEERNMLLDRGLVVGTLDDVTTAFFDYKA